MGQKTGWIIGDHLTYKPTAPSDVRFDIKRIRGMGWLFKKVVKKLPMELRAEIITKELLEKAKRHELEDKFVKKKAHKYRVLIPTSKATDVWDSVNAPVGPVRRQYKFDLFHKSPFTPANIATRNPRTIKILKRQDEELQEFEDWWKREEEGIAIRKRYKNVKKEQQELAKGRKFK